MAERSVVESGVIRVDASGRRQYGVEFKRRLAKLALEPGASVAGIALAHRINANQLFKWRQDYLRQRGETTAREPKPEATLLPVVIAPAGRTFVETRVAEAPGRPIARGLAGPGLLPTSWSRNTRTTCRSTGNPKSMPAAPDPREIPTVAA